MVQVLYLAGWGRSGTTIMDNLLGAYPGVFTAGELWYLWERGLLRSRHCGCGAPVPECALWRAILYAAFGDDPPQPRQVVSWQRECARARHTPTLLRHGHPLAAVMGRLYQAIGEVTGARLIIDSSKVPSGAALLAHTGPGVEAHLLHVVRDPRAVAYSWQRPKAHRDRPVPVNMQAHSAWDSTTKWLLWNGLTEWAAQAYPGRCRRLRYEDFAAEPRAVIEQVLAFTGTPALGGPFTGARDAQLPVNHTVSGNPGRFHTGAVTINADAAWRQELPMQARRVTTALALPMMLRYGYQP